MKQEQRMTIDFEKDQEEILDKTANINKLADKIKEMQAVQKTIEAEEEQLKQNKKHLDHISGEVIPTMLSEMGLSFLKLQDGSSIEVKTNYSATIAARLFTVLYFSYFLLMPFYTKFEKCTSPPRS